MCYIIDVASLRGHGLTTQRMVAERQQGSDWSAERQTDSHWSVLPPPDGHVTVVNFRFILRDFIILFPEDLSFSSQKMSVSSQKPLTHTENVHK